MEIINKKIIGRTEKSLSNIDMGNKRLSQAPGRLSTLFFFDTYNFFELLL